MKLQKHVIMCAAFAAALCVAEFVEAQFRKGVLEPSSDRIFAYVDRNRDGTLDPDEMRRMPPAFQEALARARISTSRPLSQEEFFRVAPRMIEEIQRGRQLRGEVPARSSKDSPRSSSESSPKKSSVSSAQRPTPQPRPRVTVDLPESYRNRDKNHDGQIGMYEWDRTAFAEFMRLDRNGDGFLTPRELTQNSTTTSTTASTTAGASTSLSTTRRPSSLAISSTPSTSGLKSSADSSSSSREARMAQFIFRSLDRNHDGSLSEEEWQRSRRTRQSFERAGVRLTLPADYDHFLADYQQASTKRR